MKKIISIVLAMVFVFSMPISVLAKGETAQEIGTELGESQVRLLTTEEALEAGFTEEQIRGRNIYEINTEYNGQIPSVLYSGDVGYEDISATGTFTGAGHTIHAKQLLVRFIKKSGNANLIVGLYSYNSNWPYGGIIYDTPTNGNDWTSDWIPLWPDDTYYFKYWISTVTSDIDKELPVNFLGLFDDDQNKKYGFSRQDLYQDIDSFSLYMPLLAKPIYDVFSEYYITNMVEGVNRRFSNFISYRILNEHLPEDIKKLDSNRDRLKELSRQYLKQDEGLITGLLGKAFSFLKNFHYDKQKYVESVAEAITYRIITKAYLE